MPGQMAFMMPEVVLVLLAEFLSSCFVRWTFIEESLQPVMELMMMGQVEIVQASCGEQHCFSSHAKVTHLLLCKQVRPIGQTCRPQTSANISQGAWSLLTVSCPDGRRKLQTLPPAGFRL
jgi:hypothetical protein